MQRQQRKSLAPLLATVLLALPLVDGCRPAHRSASGVADFGALSSGMTMARRNALRGGCGVQIGNSLDGRTETGEQALERAKGAIPSAMRQQFQQWDVQFRLSNDIQSDCRESFQRACQDMSMSGQCSSVVQYLRSCTIARNGTSSGTGSGEWRGFDIVIQNDAESIHNWLLVQSFSFFYFVLDYATTDTARNNPNVNQELSNLDGVRANIAATFLGELSTRSPQVVGRYQSMFRTTGNQLASNPKFQALVMAELSDSWFCNQQTQQDNSSFPATRQQFANFAQQYLIR
jgi:hypothetical protein